MSIFGSLDLLAGLAMVGSLGGVSKASGTWPLSRGAGPSTHETGALT